ncbi:MAG: winged helix-turn-helix domain-containing protein, partial [Chloroflexi bacterium]|nr:winged helix-turn-helix domain-containing protein [Chloroflexota bacterium]
ALPPAIERHDPWVALAAARRARNNGRWTAAIAAYAHAEAEFGPARAADAPRRERLALAAWMDPSAQPPADASGALRSGLVREPAAAARDHRGDNDPAMPVARGLLSLVAGDVVVARRLLDEAAGGGETEPVAAAAACLGSAVAAVLAGEAPDARAFDRAAEEAERAGFPWLARLGRDLARRLGPRGRDRMAAGERVPVARGRAGGEEPTEEPWSGALVALASAWAAPGGPEAAFGDAEVAADIFRRLGAGVPEAWARGLAALAASRTGAPEAREAALAAESMGRATGTPGVRLITHEALAWLDGGHGADHPLIAAAAETGLMLPGWARPVGRPMKPVEPGNGHALAGAPAYPLDAGPASPEAGRHREGVPVRIRLLGGCLLEVDGRQIVLEGAKPRVRSLFRLLALHAGAPVHREVIQEALWPDAEAEAGARSLHVALSALRRHLDDAAGPLDGHLLAREGEAYRLEVGPDDVDLGRFDRAIAVGRAARARGEAASAAF